MAYEQPAIVISREVTADLSASQFCFVKLSGGSVALCGTGQDGIGVLQNDPSASGRVGSVMVHGISKIKAGGTLTADQNVGSDSTGRAITPATGGHILGKVLEAAVANDIVSILLVRGTRVA